MDMSNCFILHIWPFREINSVSDCNGSSKAHTEVHSTLAILKSHSATKATNDYLGQSRSLSRRYFAPRSVALLHLAGLSQI